MKPKIIYDSWKIISEDIDFSLNQGYESIFSLGNGKMGHRGNFEEYFSGPSLQGTYIAGVYYPDKTKVGWWKNGYPQYFAKVINAPDWRGIKITIDGEKLDLNKVRLEEFQRELNMKHGFFAKYFVATLSNGKKVMVESRRLLSIVNDEIGLIKYVLTPLNFSGNIEVLLDIDGDVINRDSNYGEKFWTEVSRGFEPYPYVVTETKKTRFHVANVFEARFLSGGQRLRPVKIVRVKSEKYVGLVYTLPVQEHKPVEIYKYVAVTSSLCYEKGDKLLNAAFDNVRYALDRGFDHLFEEHARAWEEKWRDSDIVIEGDVAAQQGIRFNIFQLNQTYTGKDERLNIGPKGFTGEKYGGVTYWDTEAFCLPFYLSTAEPQVARNLVIYRYRHLEKAIENAQKLGFTGGAALYPMVTINGEECHNEWEITFEEIHRNGAIAYAIYNYVRYNDEPQYLAQYGLEVLIAISRFWVQRVNWSEPKQKYVMLGVTGPNEYENNVNNNWYTNYIATWTMRYTLEVMDYVRKYHPEDYQRIMEKTNFDYDKEVRCWQDIIRNMYYPYDPKRKVFLQQEGFLDKELKTVDEIPPEQRPISQHWSWDRILRSCYIKQADVLQGLFFFEDHFDVDTLRRNFEFYEPMTVHESSLSPSVYSIVASRIGKEDKAYELYLRTARLDLDDYNNEVHQGLHITSMAGTWMSITYGFGGMRVKDNKIAFTPFMPRHWQAFSFKIRFRQWLLKIWVDQEQVKITNESDTLIELMLYDNSYTIEPGQTLVKQIEHVLN